MDRGARVRWVALVILVGGVEGLMTLQFWLQFHWVLRESERCDYPEACLGTFYRHVQPTLQRAWALGAVASWATVYALHRGAHVRRASILGAATGSTLWLVLTPLSPTNHHYGWLSDSSPSAGLVLLELLAMAVLAMTAFLWLDQLWRLASICR